MNTSPASYYYVINTKTPEAYTIIDLPLSSSLVNNLESYTSLRGLFYRLVGINGDYPKITKDQGGSLPGMRSVFWQKEGLRSFHFLEILVEMYSWDLCNLLCQLIMKMYYDFFFKKLHISIGKIRFILWTIATIDSSIANGKFLLWQKLT